MLIQFIQELAGLRRETFDASLASGIVGPAGDRIADHMERALGELGRCLSAYGFESAHHVGRQGSATVVEVLMKAAIIDFALKLPDK